MSLFLAASIHCGAVAPREGGMELSGFVPTEINGWKPEEPDGNYPGEEIYRYMDGAGEVYMSYDFRELFVRQFAKENMEPITVELFDMGTAADAFGIFTRGRRGGDAGIGQGSEYDSGYLMFWKDRYFIAVYTMAETEETKQLILDLGKSIAAAIPNEGTLPDLIALLPTDSRVTDSVRYFHKHTCLNYHYFLSDENILNLSEGTEAAIAAYQGKEKESRLLIVHYPEDGQAEAAYNSFIANYLPEGKETGIARLEDGSWTAASLHGDYLLAIFDAADEGRAKELMAAVTLKLEEGAHER